MTTMADLAVVVIGRNEGARLIACLESIGSAGPVVYVDSGSTDGSIEAALARGADVVNLDLRRPFTAARARNMGLARLKARGFTGTFVQMIDGDCQLAPGWMERARAALEADPDLAIVFGRRRERHPQASIYNWLCDVEWAVPPGPVRYCGGDVMLRQSAVEAVGGYPDDMIAGEEPDLSIRLRRAGWRLECLDVEMTLHDAAIHHFGQWWRRATRAGHAYAELAARHGGDHRRRAFSALLWGVAIPVTALALIAIDIRAAVLVALLLPLQILRTAARLSRPWASALTVAAFHMLVKPAQAVGMARWAINRLRGRQATLIEYKGDDSTPGGRGGQ